MLRYKLVSFDGEGNKRNLIGCLDGLTELPVFFSYEEAEAWKLQIENRLGYVVEVIEFVGEDVRFDSIVDKNLAYAAHSHAIEGMILTDEEKRLAKKRMLREISHEEYIAEVLQRLNVDQ